MGDRLKRVRAWINQWPDRTHTLQACALIYWRNGKHMSINYAYAWNAHTDVPTCLSDQHIITNKRIMQRRTFAVASGIHKHKNYAKSFYTRIHKVAKMVHCFIVLMHTMLATMRRQCTSSPCKCMQIRQSRACTNECLAGAPNMFIQRTKRTGHPSFSPEFQNHFVSVAILDL